MRYLLCDRSKGTWEPNELNDGAIASWILACLLSIYFFADSRDGGVPMAANLPEKE